MYIFLYQTNIWTSDTQYLIHRWFCFKKYAIPQAVEEVYWSRAFLVFLFCLFFWLCKLESLTQKFRNFRTFTTRFAKFAGLIVFFFLSFSQYLENYLWVNYTPEVSNHAFIMSICCIVNEKFRENVPAWEVRPQTSDQLSCFSGDDIQCLFKAMLPSTSLSLFFSFWWDSGVQERAWPFPILLQMCEGSCISREWSRLYLKRANCPAGFPGSLFQQFGMCHYKDVTLGICVY